MIYLFAALTAGPALSQVGDGGGTTRHVDRSGFAFAFPEDWTEGSVEGFEKVIYSGDNRAYCTLRRTEDWSFGVLTPETYVKMRVEQRQDIVDLLPLQYSDGTGKLLMLKELSFGSKEGILSITKGTMEDQEVVNSVFQTIDNGASITLSCFTLVEYQGIFFPIFLRISDSFNFTTPGK